MATNKLITEIMCNAIHPDEDGFPPYATKVTEPIEKKLAKSGRMKWRRGWRAWVFQSLEAGAGAAHRWTNLPNIPSTPSDPEGKGPLTAVPNASSFWSNKWQAEDGTAFQTNAGCGSATTVREWAQASTTSVSRGLSFADTIR